MDRILKLKNVSLKFRLWKRVSSRNVAAAFVCRKTEVY